jgi:hypothetical protein
LTTTVYDTFFLCVRLIISRILRNDLSFEMKKLCSRKKSSGQIYVILLDLQFMHTFFHCENHLRPFYCYTYMSKMTLRALSFRTNIMNTPPKEDMKPLVGIRFVRRPRFLDISLQLGEKFLDGVEIWRARRQVRYVPKLVRPPTLFNRFSDPNAKTH